MSDQTPAPSSPSNSVPDSEKSQGNGNGNNGGNNGNNGNNGGPSPSAQDFAAFSGGERRQTPRRESDQTILRLAQIIEKSPEATLLLEGSGLILDANPAAQKLLNLPRHALGHPAGEPFGFLKSFSPGLWQSLSLSGILSAEGAWQGMSAFALGKTADARAFSFLSQGGADGFPVAPALIDSEGHSEAQGPRILVCAHFRDVSEEIAMRSEIARLADIAREMPDAAIAFSPTGSLLEANREGKKLLALADSAQLPSSYSAVCGLFNDELHDFFLNPETLEKARVDGVISSEGEFRAKHEASGYEGSIPIEAILISHSATGAFSLALRDLTERKLFEDEMARHALKDPLTGLPNRSWLSDAITQAISRAKRTRKKVAIAFIDLDGFKEINDSLGHEAGDEALLEASERIRKALRSGDSLARFGGDEFVALFEIVDNPQELMPASERILSSLGEPFSIEGKEIKLSGSIGIAIWPEDAFDGDGLLREADAALRIAKMRGKNQTRFFTPEIAKAAGERFALYSGLKKALFQNELFCAFQQPINLDSSLIAPPKEALLRWRREDGSILPADSFFEAISETGLILEASKKYFEKGFLALDWFPESRIALNISARELAESDIARTIERAFRAASADPARFELELADGALEWAGRRAKTLLKDFISMGFTLCLDSIGEGRESLVALCETPFTRAKLPRSICLKLHEDPKSEALAISLVALCQAIGARPCAKGIEEDKQLEVAKAIGCKEAQGFLVSPIEFPPDGSSSENAKILKNP